MATHNAVHGQWVPVLQDNENNTVYAPADPVEGHWFGVKHLSTGAGAFLTTIDGNGNLIESVEGVGGKPSTEILMPLRAYRWHYINAQWRLTAAFHPAVHYEPWGYEGTDLLIGTNTRIPLTFDGTFSPVSDYFEAVGDGTIRCLSRFVGFIDAMLYASFVMTGNNQDAMAVMTINVVSGTALVRQGHGIGGSTFSPRPATLEESRAGRWPAIIEPLAVLELRASDDVAQAGTSYVLEQTAISFQVA